MALSVATAARLPPLRRRRAAAGARAAARAAARGGAGGGRRACAAAAGDGDVQAAAAPPLDVGYCVKYTGATLLQLGALCGVLGALDAAAPQLGALHPALPKASVVLFLLFCSLKSRVFSPLNAKRTARVLKDREIKRPAWTPPGLAFPIIWSTIAILRATSGAMVWQAAGQTALCAPLAWFMAHLAVGDLWNAMYTVENRLGAGVVGVLIVLCSVWNVALQYYNTLPMAGYVILPSALWITVATFLVYSIWRLNGSEPLYPFQEAGDK